MTHLQELDVTRNPIEDGSVIGSTLADPSPVGKLMTLPKLKQVNLLGNDIKEGVTLKELRNLDIWIE